MSDGEGRLLRHDQSGRDSEVEVSQDGPSGVRGCGDGGDCVVLRK